jgi:hypothetical protein
MRIPFEFVDVEVLDLSEIIADIKNRMETDPVETEELTRDNVKFDLLNISFVGKDLGIAQIGDKVFALDTHGVGYDLSDGKKANLIFGIFIRIYDDNKKQETIDKGMHHGGRHFEVQIPTSLLLKMPKKETVHLEDFIMSYGEGLDNIYEEWRVLLMNAIPAITE